MRIIRLFKTKSTKLKEAIDEMIGVKTERWEEGTSVFQAKRFGVERNKKEWQDELKDATVVLRDKVLPLLAIRDVSW